MKDDFHLPGAPNRPSLSKESAHLVTLPAFRTIRSLERPHYRMITCYSMAAAAAAKSLQSCQTLCDPINGSPPGSPVPGILQARTLEWVAISFSNAWKWKVKSESEVAQWCLTLRNPMDCSLPGSSIHGIFQARVLEWGAIAFSGYSMAITRQIWFPCIQRLTFHKENSIFYILPY